VQFVPYRLFLSSQSHEARLNLAREVLAEIPDQVTSYMFDNRKTPSDHISQQDAPPPYAP